MNNRLKEIMLDQKVVFNNRKDLIKRDIELDKYVSTGQVVIVSGIRRCGKSSLLFLIKERMGLSEEEFCYFNFDDERIIVDSYLPESIYNLHLEVYGKEPVLFLDEIQNIPQWEKFVNRMHEAGTKIFVTGSNALLLSSEISTTLTGRNKVIELFPFSFAEYLRFKGREYNLNRLSTKNKLLLKRDFNEYVAIGGFPLVVKEQDLELINAYFQDILYRDIISRYRLSQVNEIRQIGLYLASNIGKLFSYATLKSVSGVKSLSSIKDYLGYFQQSYLFLYLKKFDYSVKKQIMNPSKAYTIDPAFAHRIGFGFSQNLGRVMENLVYLQLLREGKEVFYHAGRYECDFLVREGLAIIGAIQVVWQLDSVNQNREYNGLIEALDTYSLSRGTLITYETSEHVPQPDERIQIVPIWQWLLGPH